MDDDIPLPFNLPAVERKKISAAFETDATIDHARVLSAAGSLPAKCPGE